MIVTIILKSIFIYFFILLIMKIMGKREIGQLSLFDFVVLLIIADVSVIGLDNDEGPFYVYLIPIVILAAIQKILAFMLLKFPKLRAIFDGKESVIVHDGILDVKEMKKQSYNVDDLIVQLRLKNIASLSEVKDVILETNGEISIFLKNGETKVSPYTRSKPSSVVTSPSSSKVLDYASNLSPFPVIVSGDINKENLKRLNLTEKWLYKELNKLGYDDVKSIYYANYEKDSLFIMPTKN